jgi:exonuclease III
MTQESRVAEDSAVYDLLLQNFMVYKNPNPLSSNSAGTDIFVRKEFSKHFRIIPAIVVQGYIQSLSFVPLSPDSPFEANFRLLNVYLRHGSAKEDYAHRFSSLSALTEAFPLPPRYVIAGGDWNMTEFPVDSSSADHFASSPRMRSAFNSFLKHFKLKEIHQPAHTRFEGKVSSRLDRFYCSHSLADKCLASPEVTLPPHRYQPGAEEHPSDHFPILLSFYDATLSPHTRHKIPDWLATSTEYLSAVRERYASLNKKPRHPVKAWLQFKKCARQTAMQLLCTYRAQPRTKA